MIVQARLGSTRLPGKVLLPFGDDTLLGSVLDRLRTLPKTWTLLVATTTSPADQPLVDYCWRRKTACFRGSEGNVLQRYTGAARQCGCETIVRVCADNPFIDPAGIPPMVERLVADQLDYCSYRFPDERPAILTALGLYAECTTLGALQTASDAGVGKEYYEHVTRYLYTHPERFRLGWLPVLPEFAPCRVRLTCDTPGDYRNLLRVRDLARDPDISAQALHARVVADQQLLAAMAVEDQANRKV